MVVSVGEGNISSGSSSSSSGNSSSGSNSDSSASKNKNTAFLQQKNVLKEQHEANVKLEKMQETNEKLLAVLERIEAAQMVQSMSALQKMETVVEGAEGQEKLTFHERPVDAGQEVSGEHKVTVGTGLSQSQDQTHARLVKAAQLLAEHGRDIVGAGAVGAGAVLVA